MITVITQSLSYVGFEVLTYLIEWLVQAPFINQCIQDHDTTLRTYHNMGFLISLQTFCLSPTQSITWLGMELDSWTATLHAVAGETKPDQVQTVSCLVLENFLLVDVGEPHVLYQICHRAGFS